MKKKRKVIAIVLSALVVCIAFVITLFAVILPNREKNGQYAAAVELYDAGKYEEAIEAFTALGGYKDSADQIDRCKTAIYEDDYAAALALYEAKAYGEAYAALSKLDGYKDSAELLEEVKAIYFPQLFSDAEVGSTVFFGSYEQFGGAGKEDIEWIVLEKEAGRIFVISKYALDCQRYSTSFEDISWQTSPLRRWLNDTFLKEAFSEQERAQIPTVTVTADKNPYYDTDCGADTQDQLFLLSMKEVYRYFPSDSDRECEGTEYCYDECGADKYPNGMCWWWLRTPGEETNTTTYVRGDGTVGYWGDSYLLHIENRTYEVYYAVRPAMWIELPN